MNVQRKVAVKVICMAFVAVAVAGCADSGSSVEQTAASGSPIQAPSTPAPSDVPAEPAPSDVPAPPAPSDVPTQPAPLFTPDVPQGVTPVAVSIPSIGVENANTIDLGIQADGSLEVPSDFDDTGWFTKAPKPGAPGAAVIAGHVDSRNGPAVFYRLNELSEGDKVMVQGKDGEEVVFSVDSIEQYPKDDFPSERVYGYVNEPQLRLITCGGEFDRSERSYRDNIVVYASVVESA
jgi:LPXTG-site transpeptidase (sortase) family protein